MLPLRDQAIPHRSNIDTSKLVARSSKLPQTFVAPFCNTFDRLQTCNKQGTLLKQRADVMACCSSSGIHRITSLLTTQFI
jgi:hypothetical protein